MTLGWQNGKLVDIEDNAKMVDSWVRRGKLFNVGDKVRVLDGSADKIIVGYEWDVRFHPHVGRIRTVQSRIINHYGYIVGYKLKNCPGIFNPDFLERKV